MLIEKSPQIFQQSMSAIKKAGQSIGFVPTMGALHEGHLSLVALSLKKCDYTVVSIYVNPTQFSPNEDLDRYPKPLEEDLAKLRSIGVEAVFIPESDVIYPPDYETYVSVEKTTTVLCGASRPTHFRGVTTIVTKLFNIVQPDYAFFGSKDYQQVTVIKRMVTDLNMPVQIITGSIIREADGLAMSSRNKLLSPDARKQAVVIFESLNNAKKTASDKTPEYIKKQIISKIEEQPLAQIDYVELVDPHSLQPAAPQSTQLLAVVAVFFEETRLIDNMIIR